jgi:hypothetical protein
VAEEETERRQAQTTRRRRRLRWWVLVFLGTALVILVFLWISHRAGTPSIEQRLAAIEAARAIPDEENAAVIYNTLAGSSLAFQSAEDDLGVAVDRATRTFPWTASDYPEAAQWVQEHQGLMDTLLKASGHSQCRFAIDEETRYSQENRHLVCECIYLLQRAANNDIGEGRMEPAIEKCKCLLRLAQHLRQQPTLIDHLLSINVEFAGLRTLANVIMDNRSTRADSDVIAALPIPTELTWTTSRQLMTEVENLFAAIRRRNMSVLQRLQECFAGPTVEECIEGAERPYLRLLAQRRGTHIILALKKYRSTHARWPQSLDEVKSLVPPEVFVDPLNGGAFVYKLTQDSFTLYSKGENSIDENGNRTGGADDRPIWPRPSRRTQSRQPTQ